MSWTVLLLCRSLPSHAHASGSHKYRCPLQGRQVTMELLTQGGLVWPCCAPQSIVKWAVLEQMFCGHRSGVIAEHLRLANPHFVVEMSSQPRMSCSEPEQDYLVCSCLGVLAVRPVVVGMLLTPTF